MSADLKAKLAKLGEVLGVETLPPGTEAPKMSPQQFFDKAVAEMTKAKEELAAGQTVEAQKRLDILKANIERALTVKGAWEGATGAPSIPMYEEKDITSKKEQTESSGNMQQQQPGGSVASNMAPTFKSLDEGLKTIDTLLKDLVGEAAPVQPATTETAPAVPDIAWPKDLAGKEFLDTGNVQKNADGWGSDPWKK